MRFYGGFEVGTGIASKGGVCKPKTRKANMTKTAYDFPVVGCYIDESAGSADDCNKRTIDFAEGYGFEHEPIPDDSGDDNDCDCEDSDRSQLLSEIADDAVDYLNSLETRSFMSWGFDDNSLFLVADVDGARAAKQKRKARK